MAERKATELNSATVEAYELLVKNPNAYGLPFRSITVCFEPSAVVTAKHVLARHYIENETPLLPKLMCYIIMDKVFGQCTGKDDQGYLGYHLKYIPR